MKMAYDREVLRMIWEGQIALCFQADPDEIVGLHQPESFYLMVPRLSYFPLVTDKVKKYFSRFIATDQQDGSVWFDYNGIPLKLHYPIANGGILSYNNRFVLKCSFRIYDDLEKIISTPQLREIFQRRYKSSDSTIKVELSL